MLIINQYLKKIVKWDILSDFQTLCKKVLKKRVNELVISMQKIEQKGSALLEFCLIHQMFFKQATIHFHFISLFFFNDYPSSKLYKSTTTKLQSLDYRTYSTCVQAKGKIFLGARGKRAPPYALARVSRVSWSSAAAVCCEVRSGHHLVPKIQSF